jgi:hypothetical protein
MSQQKAMAKVPISNWLERFFQPRRQLLSGGQRVFSKNNMRLNVKHKSENKIKRRGP